MVHFLLAPSRIIALAWAYLIVVFAYSYSFLSQLTTTEITLKIFWVSVLTAIAFAPLETLSRNPIALARFNAAIHLSVLMVMLFNWLPKTINYDNLPQVTANLAYSIIPMLIVSPIPLCIRKMAAAHNIQSKAGDKKILNIYALSIAIPTIISMGLYQIVYP